MSTEHITATDGTTRRPPVVAGSAVIAVSTALVVAGDGHGTEPALRSGLLSAVALAAVARWPHSAAPVALASAMGLGLLSDRSTAVAAVLAGALWLAAAGVLRPGWTVELPWSTAAGVAAAMVLAASGTAMAWTLLLLAAIVVGQLALRARGTPAALKRFDGRLGAVGDRHRRTDPRRAGFGAGQRRELAPDDPGGRSGADGLLVPGSIWAAATLAGTWIQNVAVRTAENGWDLAAVLGLPAPTAGKGGWDTLYYLNIAELGYRLPATQDFTSRPESDLVAYFPGYPMAIRALSVLPGIDGPLASILIAAAAGLGATLLMWVWMGDRGVDRPSRVLATVLVTLYPWSFLLTGVAYADPLALAFVLGAVVLVTRGHHVLGGLVGAAATITRPTCLGLVVALPLIALDTDGVVLGRGTWRAAVTDLGRRWGVLLTGGGAGAYAVWLWFDRRDPVAFWTVQSSYGQGSALELSTWFKVEFARWLPDAPWSAETVNRLGAILATAVVAACTPAVARRFGTGYAVWTGSLVAAVLVGARYFSPGGRYLMLAFPVAALVAEPLTRRRRAAALAVGVMALGWVALTWRFARTDSLGW